MAKRIQTYLIDDITGNDADETVSFGLDGTLYEIDLATEGAKIVREALAPFISAGRRVNSLPRTVSARRVNSPVVERAGVDPSVVRAWAQQNGVPISSRGRVSKEIVEQYLAAN